MPIRWVSGDLFANAYKVQAFAQGCNCQGSMWAGIAKGFRQRYPRMYEEYRNRCKAEPRQFNLGEVWLWKDERRPWVFNLGTQEGFWHARASYEAIEESLTRMRALAESEGVESIALPRIGAGYGGLSWKKVRPIIERVFGDWPGTLVVYEQFAPRGSKQTAEESAQPDHAHTTLRAIMSNPREPAAERWRQAKESLCTKPPTLRWAGFSVGWQWSSEFCPWGWVSPIS